MTEDAQPIAEAVPELDRVPRESDLARLREQRLRRAKIGFGLGILAAFPLTAIQVTFRGWTNLGLIAWNLVWAPMLCASLGYGSRPVPGDPGFSWRRFRVRTSTLMLLVAYVALWLGMIVLAQPIAVAAGQYRSKATSSKFLATIDRDLAEKSAAEAPVRLANAAALRAGKISTQVSADQIRFLNSLEGTATPEYRKARYESMAATEEQVGRAEERNAAIFRGLAAYHEALAAKYEAAARRPWLPVEPDPPMPPTQ